MRDAERSGIRVVGIGIADDAVCDYYRDWIVVRRLSELPERLLGVLEDVLLKDTR